MCVSSRCLSYFAQLRFSGIGKNHGKSDSGQNHPHLQETKVRVGRMQFWKETENIGKQRIVNSRDWLAFPGEINWPRIEAIQGSEFKNVKMCQLQPKGNNLSSPTKSDLFTITYNFAPRKFKQLR